MKKLFACLMCLMMVVSFAACGSTEPAGEDPQAADPAAQAEDPAAAGLPNPATEVESLEALCEEFGCAIAHPESVQVTEEKFFSVDADPKFAEYMFTADGVECALRVAAVGPDQDISGYWTENGTAFEGSAEETGYYEDADAKLMRWFTLDGQYVLLARDAGAWEEDAFKALADEFRGVKPVNWNSDGFEDYEAAIGEYADETSQRAVATFEIKENHAKIVVKWANSASETMVWTMEGFMENNVVAYDEERCERWTAGPDGKVTAELVDEGGEGSVEFRDGKLYFNDAYDETLRDCVFAPVGK